MEATFTVSHAKYTGSTDSDGYPTGDDYADPVSRNVFGWYPLSSSLSPAGEYDRRVITSKVVLVPDPSVFGVRDQVVLPGTEPVESRTFFVSEDIRDYNSGPFGFRPGGEIVLEKVSG